MNSSREGAAARCGPWSLVLLTLLAIVFVVLGVTFGATDPLGWFEKKSRRVIVVQSVSDGSGLISDEYARERSSRANAERSLADAILRGDGFRSEVERLKSENDRLIGLVDAMKSDAAKHVCPVTEVTLPEPKVSRPPPAPSVFMPVTVYRSLNQYEYGADQKSRPFCVSEEIQRGQVFVARRPGLMMEVEVGHNLMRRNDPITMPVNLDDEVIAVPPGAKKIRFYYTREGAADDVPLRVIVRE